MKRQDFLRKIKRKLEDAVVPDAGVGHPGSFEAYSWKSSSSAAERVAQFKQELEALKGAVYVLDDVEAAAETILSILEKHQTQRIIAWDDDSLNLPHLSDVLKEAGVSFSEDVLPKEADGRKAHLAAIDDVFVGLTGAQGGLADTGAIALISGRGRGRLASLAPPVHIALLKREDIYPSLPAFLSAYPEATKDSSNLVFIAGPSRSGDIEMTLSIGVHGPGEVHVIIIP